MASLTSTFKPGDPIRIKVGINGGTMAHPEPTRFEWWKAVVRAVHDTGITAELLEGFGAARDRPMHPLSFNTLNKTWRRDQ